MIFPISMAWLAGELHLGPGGKHASLRRYGILGQWTYSHNDSRQSTLSGTCGSLPVVAPHLYPPDGGSPHISLGGAIARRSDRPDTAACCSNRCILIIAWLGLLTIGAERKVAGVAGASHCLGAAFVKANLDRTCRAGANQVAGPASAQAGG